MRKHNEVLEQLRSLARGPCPGILAYQGFFHNGYKYETKSLEESRTTQNNGVVTIGDVDGNVWYGVLIEIIEVSFMMQSPIYLFKCKWYDMTPNKGLVIDEFNFTSVNTTRQSYEDEPFILPTQVQQVYYSKDPSKKDWSVAMRWKPRDTYELPDEVNMEEANHENALEEENVYEFEDPMVTEPSIFNEGVLEGEGHVDWVRRDVTTLRVKDKVVNKAKRLRKL